MDFLRQRQALAGKWSRDLDAAVTNVLVLALQNGSDVRTTMAALARVFPTLSRGRLEYIARTEATTAYNVGRLPGRGRLCGRVQFSAILDARTTDICRSRDGLVMRMDDPRLPANTPPLHFQCRSVLIPVDRIAWRR
ncbi:MAG: phage minor head protein, partial [Candidatus Eremiobacterota bacterium]